MIFLNSKIDYHRTGMDEFMRSVRSSVSSVAEFQRENIIAPLQQLFDQDLATPPPATSPSSQAAHLSGPVLPKSTGKHSYQSIPATFDRDMAQCGSSVTGMGSLWFLSGGSTPPLSTGASRGAAVFFMAATIGLAKLALDEGFAEDQDVKLGIKREGAHWPDPK